MEPIQNSHDTKQSPIIESRPKYTWYAYLALGICVAVMCFGGLWYVLTARDQSFTPLEKEKDDILMTDDSPEEMARTPVVSEEFNEEAHATLSALMPQSAVLLFVEEIDSLSTAGRSWPIHRIMRKVGDAQVEFLAEVGAIGEYPAAYELSPNKEFLLISLEHKLQVLDLATKELSDLFVPHYRIDNMSISADGGRIFVWDMDPYDGDDSVYRFHEINMHTKESRILMTEQDIPDYYSSAMYQRVMDIDPYAVKALPVPAKGIERYDFLSDVYTAYPTKRIASACSMSSDRPSHFMIRDHDGKEVREVGIAGKIIEMISSAPDGDRVIYKTQDPFPESFDCSYEIFRPTDYYVVAMNSGETYSVTTAEVSALLQQWNVPYVGGEESRIDPDAYGNEYIIAIFGKTMLMSKHDLRIIGQFYQ